MGNCCDRLFKAQEFKMPLEIDQIEAIARRNIAETIGKLPQSIGLVDSELLPELESDPQKLILKRLIDEAQIAAMTDQFLNEMMQYRPQVQLMKTFEKDGIKGQFSGMNLPKENSSELQTVFIQDFEVPFSAEFFMWSSLNQEVKITESFAEDEIIQVEANPNTIIILNRMKTEKVLLVAPRNILMVRVIRRIDKDKYLDLNQTVDVTPLVSNPKIKDMMEALKENFATTHISGVYIENKGDRCRLSSYVRSDFRSSVKMTFLKMFLARNFENTMLNTGKNMQQIWSQNSWEKKKGIWFEDKKGEQLALGWTGDKQRAKLQTTAPVEMKTSDANETMEAEAEKGKAIAVTTF